MNRAIFSMNKLADKVVIRPVAVGYSKILPQTIQAGVSNFFDNLRDVSTSANDILQWKWGQFANDLTRVVINSTIGLAGFFDPATLMGLPQHKEDFGQTLAHWGYENSVYIVLPILGPSTIRDTVGLFVDYHFISVWPLIESEELKYGLLAVDLTDYRVKQLRTENTISAIAIDEYVFIRNAYLQHRKFLYTNGQVLEDLPEGPDNIMDRKTKA